MRVELRRWQAEALDLWCVRRRGVVAVVTGGGKTTFAIECVRWALSARPGLRILVTVPTVALQDQWLEEFAAQMAQIEVTDRYPGGPTSQIFVLVNDTARNVVPTISDYGDWMQVVDECHRAATTENQRTLMPDSWACLGLSATPERQYDDNYELMLRPVLGPIIYRYSYVDALRDGVISQFMLENYRVPLSDEEHAAIGSVSNSIARATRQHGREDERVKALLMRRARLVQQVRAREVVAAELVHRNGESTSAIVFHESTRAADRIAERLRELGHSVSVYHSNMSPVARRRDLHLYRIGVTSVLVCCRALDEGLNVPRAKFAVVAASTATTRQRIQRLGRMLRPDGNAAMAVISTLYATDTEASRLLDESAELEGVADVRWFRADFGGVACS